MRPAGCSTSPHRRRPRPARRGDVQPARSQPRQPRRGSRRRAERRLGGLLIYRKDLFRRAGLPAPRTLDDVVRAARGLDRRGARWRDHARHRAGRRVHLGDVRARRAGRGLPAGRRPGPREAHLAACEKAFSPTASSRATTGPGDPGRRLDPSHVLRRPQRDDHLVAVPARRDGRPAQRRRPDVPQCQADPAFLAHNSGLVGPLQSGGAARPPRSSARSSRGASPPGPSPRRRSQSSRSMISDGYLRWLALSPQGKYPLRPATGRTPSASRRRGRACRAAWSATRAAPVLRPGADRVARRGRPLLPALGLPAGPRGADRRAQQPGADRGALALAIVGAIDPPTAARQAQLEVQAVKDGLR